MDSAFGMSGKTVSMESCILFEMRLNDFFVRPNIIENTLSSATNTEQTQQEHTQIEKEKHTHFVTMVQCQ